MGLTEGNKVLKKSIADLELIKKNLGKTGYGDELSSNGYSGLEEFKNEFTVLISRLSSFIKSYGKNK